MNATADKIRQWLTTTVSTGAVASVEEWATKSGVHRSTIFRAMKPGYEFVTSSRTLAKLAQAAGVSPPDIGDAGDNAPQAMQMVELPIRYEVAAGAFLERDDYRQEGYGKMAVPVDPRYTGYPQWLERVVNDSMDRVFPPGALLHVVDAIATGYEPRQNDIVIVERTRAQGALVERTVKQVEVTPSGLILWPRSHNPRWDTPLDLTAGVGVDEDMEVSIVGRVLATYMRFD